MGKKTSIHIFHSPGTAIESRLYKTCHSITKLGIVDQVIALCYKEENLKNIEIINDQFKIVRINCFKNFLRSRKKSYFRTFLALLSFLKYVFSLILFCVQKKPNYISCHNAQLLPFCYIIKIITRCKLIYEPHELESHKTGLSEKAKQFTKYIEKKNIPHCNSIICVCEPITEFYKKEFSIPESKIFTIANVPINPTFGKTFTKTNLFRKEFNIPEDHVIFLYQGLIGESRGLDVYLDTFQKLPKDFHMIFMGYGTGLEKVLKYCKKNSNIHYKEAVEQNQIINYSSSADVGLFFLTGDITLSYRYSLPNKFFEYAIAGLKICVSDNLVLLNSYVNQYKLGDIISSNEDSLYDFIMKNKDNPQYFKNSDTESFDYRKNFGWQNEEKIFVEVYNSLNG